jgi:hypothetical protein
MTEHMAPSEIELIRLQRQESTTHLELRKEEHEYNRAFAEASERRAIRLRCLELSRSGLFLDTEADYDAIKSRVDKLEAIVYDN